LVNLDIGTSPYLERCMKFSCSGTGNYETVDGLGLVVFCRAGDLAPAGFMSAIRHT
jgi:hypothetical protein